jgi:hypothetical protein
MRGALPAKQAGLCNPGGLLIVHRLCGSPRKSQKKGFILRTRGDNLLACDDKTWTESEFAGKATSLLRRTETGYASVQIQTRMNRWHAALSRFEERLYLQMRFLKRHLVGPCPLPLSGLIIPVVHGLTGTGHMLMNQATALCFCAKNDNAHD